MIYITGDTHSDFSRFDDDRFPIQKELNKKDYMVICGDFGGVWTFGNESDYEKYNLDKLNSKNFTTLFVDGNHENFTRLYNYPKAIFNGGMVHIIRKNIFHLIRGQIYTIDGKKFFAFGGAKSHDISDGILNMDQEEQIYNFRKMNASFRIRDFSWWDLELPTQQEMESGLKNLEKVNFKVDYIFSHCAPTNIQALLGRNFKKDILTNYLQQIYEKCEFKKWFFGHYHENRYINEQFRVLYEDIVPIEWNYIEK